jgi:hypothetical protein
MEAAQMPITRPAEDVMSGTPCCGRLAPSVIAIEIEPGPTVIGKASG